MISTSYDLARELLSKRFEGAAGNGGAGRANIRLFVSTGNRKGQER